MKKLITIILGLFAGMSSVRAQQYFCQPYYGENKIRFYNTNGPVAASPYYTLDLSADVKAAWGVTTNGPNDVLVYNNKIFVSFDLGDRGGVLIYNYSDVYPARNANPPVVIKPQIANGLETAGIAINPANGDLYLATFNDGADDSGVYTYTAASGYATGSQFSSYLNDASVAAVCANLAFDHSGNLWMTTWTADNKAADHLLICYKGLNKNNYYKITNTPTPTYTATDYNGSTVSNLNLLSAPEGIAFDPAGNLWLGNNNDFALTNGAGQGTLVKFSASWITTLLGSPSTGTGAGNPTYTVPSAQASIKYIAKGKLGGLAFSGNTIYINDQGQNQGTDYTASGTVWQWDVTSAFTTTNFKASGIHTTYPGNGGGAVMTNVYMQDNSGDTGIEPNTTTAVINASPDIWIRQANDGLTNQHTSQNVIGGQTCYIYVMVHDIGMFPSDAADKLNLYWAKVGTTLSWPSPWTSGAANSPKLGDLIGTQSVSVIKYGQYAILVYPWTAPNPTDYTALFPAQSGSFSLLARLLTSSVAPYGMTTPETTNLSQNVLFNDKIVSDNVNILASSVLPTLSYSSPKTFTTGTAIAALTPTSSGVVAPGYSSSTITLASFFSPTGIASDAAGNVYFADPGDLIVFKIPAGGGAPVNVGTAFSLPTSVAVDAAGNLYVTDRGPGTANKIPFAGGAPVVLASGFINPVGVAVDATGNVYVADQGNNTLYKIVKSSGAKTILVSGFSNLSGVATDAAGNLYITDAGNNTVKKIATTGGAPVTLGSGFNGPLGVVVDNLGNIFVADAGNNAVKKIPAGGGAPVTIGTGFIQPAGVGIDGAGNLYVTDPGNFAVKVIKPSGGYYISPALPAGLSFSGTTGVISGTPTAASPATNYTITAYNSYGGAPSTLNITVNLPAVPAINFAPPQPFVAGVAITPLVPVSNGVAPPGFSSNPVSLSQGLLPSNVMLGGSTVKKPFANPGASAIISSGFISPTGVTADAAGNVFVADTGNHTLKKIPFGGGAPVVIDTGLTSTGPFGVAADAAGNLYVTSPGTSQVFKIPVGGGVPVSIGSGFIVPKGVAADALGNVYVSDQGSNSVDMIPVGGGSVATIGTGFSAPNGVAVDAAGNVYVADAGNNAVKKIPFGGGAAVIIGSGFSVPSGVAVDVAGNVFVSDAGNNAVKEIPVGGGGPVTIGSGFIAPSAVALDAAGIVYVADPGNNDVKEIKPIGGYYISAALSAGLNFNFITGVISGTPTITNPGTNYTVDAYNSGGGSSAVVNIKIGPNANLAALKISSGTLTPAFAPGTTSYSASVVNNLSSINQNATIWFDGMV